MHRFSASLYACCTLVGMYVMAWAGAGQDDVSVAFLGSFHFVHVMLESGFLLKCSTCLQVLTRPS